MPTKTNPKYHRRQSRGHELRMQHRTAPTLTSRNCTADRRRKTTRNLSVQTTWERNLPPTIEPNQREATRNSQEFQLLKHTFWISLLAPPLWAVQSPRTISDYDWLFTDPLDTKPWASQVALNSPNPNTRARNQPHSIPVKSPNRESRREQSKGRSTNPRRSGPRRSQSPKNFYAPKRNESFSNTTQVT